MLRRKASAVWPLAVSLVMARALTNIDRREIKSVVFLRRDL